MNTYRFKIISYTFTFLICQFGLILNSFAQFSFEYNNQIPVIKSGNLLTNSWAGGLNQVQVSDFDYDYDGDLDLFFFDRSKNNIRVYSQENSGTPFYQNVYNAKSLFPEGIYYRATLIDYDGDGKKDLFTYNLSGIQVFKNTGSFATGLQWTLVTNLLYADDQGSTVQLFVNASDIPAIEDIDFDGDIDILTFEQGGTHVLYYQNQSQELYGHSDSLVYEIKNYCWGLFAEDFNSSSLILNDPNAPCGTGNIPNPEKSTKKHAGSTLLALDYDNSGVMDLIVGDISSNKLTLTLNGGVSPNTNSAMVSQDINFPSNNVPVDLTLFPAAFFVDVNFDGIKDLIATPNSTTTSENESSVWFYQNNGSNQNPNFSLVRKNHFQNEEIEHGVGSIPVLFDFNEDGLKDLLVANFYKYKTATERVSSIAYYLNTGTANNPEFTFIDNDLLNLSQNNLGLRLVPTFADLDNDNDQDMIIGHDDGTLTYYENQSIGSGAQFTIAPTPVLDQLSSTIDVGQFAYPQLFDLNKDNLTDLIIGDKNGAIAYYQNTGTINTPQFTLVTNNLGGVDLSGGFNNAFVAPNFIRNNDTTYLFVGTNDGDIAFYDSIDNNLTGNFNQVTNRLANINVEGYAAPFIEDLDNNGLLNLFLGQDLGGLYHFEHDPNSSVWINELKDYPRIIVFPNPSAGKIQIQSSLNIKNVKVFNNLGQIIPAQINKNSNYFEVHINTKGIYYLEISTDDSTSIEKVIIQ